MMVKEKWLGLSTYMTFFPCFMRKMNFLTNMPVFYLYTHFTNIHFISFSAYWLTSCSHLSTSVILLKTHSIILIQTILTRSCYSNGGFCMNQLLIFGSASLTCSFKLWGAIWNLLISGTASSISLRNLLVPRGSLKSSLTQHSSLMELRNLMCMQSLS